MKKLPVELRENGCTYTLVYRTNEKAMYKSNKDFYEVFKIKTRLKEKFKGKEYPEREVYPRKEDFGRTAWCFSKFKKAHRRYREL